MSKTYIAKLKAETEAANLRSEKAKASRKVSDARIVCDVPLTNQIQALMQSLPPVQFNRPWSMEEFVARLEGRFSAHPHPMNIGAALRQLGWVSMRDWSAQGAGRRVWKFGQE